jgi:hypothetical protein
MECLRIAIAESMPVIFNQGRTHRRVPEVRMPFHFRPSAVVNISPRRLHAVVKSLSRYLGINRRRWRIVRRRMTAPSQCHGQQERRQNQCPFHEISPLLQIWIAAGRPCASQRPGLHANPNPLRCQMSRTSRRWAYPNRDGLNQLGAPYLPKFFSGRWVHLRRTRGSRGISSPE